jgi:hypothetical protein
LKPAQASVSSGSCSTQRHAMPSAHGLATKQPCEYNPLPAPGSAVYVTDTPPQPQPDFPQNPAAHSSTQQHTAAHSSTQSPQLMPGRTAAPFKGQLLKFGRSLWRAMCSPQCSMNDPPPPRPLHTHHPSPGAQPTPTPTRPSTPICLYTPPLTTQPSSA